MNEDIRKNEIAEAALEHATGGATDFSGAKLCPHCGNKMMPICRNENGAWVVDYYNCSRCKHKEY